MAEAEEVDEQLKASDQLGWISRMNSIRQRAEETVLDELIFD
ncbi:MAG: TnpV protein [Clostridiales bacterium]|nr:TnpV protein [Clostridiales bacterium]